MSAGRVGCEACGVGVWLGCDTNGPGCGARGRWRGLAGQRVDAPSEARGADGSRAGRRPRAHKAALPNKTDDAVIRGLATRAAIEKCVGFTASKTVEDQ